MRKARRSSASAARNVARKRAKSRCTVEDRVPVQLASCTGVCDMPCLLVAQEGDGEVVFEALPAGTLPEDVLPQVLPSAAS